MRLLIFAHDASLYGASQSLLTLVENFKENNLAEMFVILPHNGPMEDKLRKLEVNFQVILFPRCFSRKKSSNAFVRLIYIFKYDRLVKKVMPDLNNLVKQFRPDIIYSNTSIVSIGSVLSKKNALPHVWHIRESADFFYNFEYLPSKKKVIEQMNKSNRVIFVSKALQQHWFQNTIGNSSVVYNGLVNTTFSEREYPTKSFRFGILGAIVPGKGQDIAIKAIFLLSKKYPSVTLYLYGNIVDKKYYEEIKEIVRVSGCPTNVIFKGFEENQDLIYSNIDVLLSCSTMEGFGRTIVEAMNRGIPVIANASGGPLEIIKQNENGLLYDHSTESLVSCMENIMGDKKLYQSISQKGARDSLNYSIQTYADKVFDVLKSAISQ